MRETNQGVIEMGKYLVKGNYVGEGIAGLLSDGGSKRVAAKSGSFPS